LLCKEVEGKSYCRIPVFPATVKRNAFGRQRESFVRNLSIPIIGEPPFKGIFIRAPYIETVGPEVNILCKLDDEKIVMAEYKNMLVCAFHPELTNDLRIHRFFLEKS
ncbi:MAG: pyridoxal 5'-phosphate synthase glutaminase subunit PdxT, partial [bacterium]